MPSSDRTTEYEIGQAVLRYLAGIEDGSATIAEIKRHLDRSYPFTTSDRQLSYTRPHEERWHQQVRNLMSHRLTSGNAICDGLLDYSPRRLAITKLGREYLEQRYGAGIQRESDDSAHNRLLL
jgi:hypothetical protein